MVCTPVKFNKAKFLLFVYVFNSILLFTCNRESIESEQSNNIYDSLNIFLQIDSIAYKNPGLALNLLETTVPDLEHQLTIKSAYYHYYKGRIFLLEKDGYKQALPILQKALELEDELGLLELKVKTYQELAIAYSKQRKLTQAMEVLDKAFNLAEKINYKNISSLYIEAGWVLFELDATNPKAKEYLFRAINNHQNQFDSVFFAKVYHNLATIYLNEANSDSAMFYVSKAIGIFEKFQLTNVLCNAYNTMGAVYEKKDDKINALKFYKLSASTGDVAGIETAFIYANIGRYYQYSLHDNNNALNYYLKSLERPGNPKNLYTILESIAGIYEQQGANLLALDYYKKAMALKKSDLEQNYQESLKRLEVEFDVKRDKQRMKELSLTLQNQNMKVRQQQILILGLSLFVVMIMGMAMLFIRQKNLKQEYQKVLLEQQLLRTQMNPHFIFNAISVIQYLIKNNQNSQADKYLSKFSRLLRKSLENSIGQFAPVQDEVELLEDYLALQKLRFTEEFEYEIKTYNDFEDDISLIPPMIIQPFVENCIEHGIRDIGRKGRIDINLTKNEKTIVCIVEDNGRGFNFSNKKGGTGKRSLSTIISKKRLEIIQKKLKIESKIEIIDRMEKYGENGTQIIITLPIIT